MKHARKRTAWRAWSAPLAAMLTGGCVGAGSSDLPPVSAAPALHEYSGAFEAKLVEELNALDGECGRDVVVPPCSALHTFTLDGIQLRDRVRAGQ